MTGQPLVAERDVTPPGWRPEDWENVLLLLREWFVSKPEDWTTNRLTGYALGLADFTAAQVGAALRRLRDAPGRTFLPRVSEIADAIHTDRSDPSFGEAFELLFGKGGCVHARPAAGVRYDGQTERDKATDLAILEKAIDQHELVGAFVAAVTPRRLRLIPIDDPEYGDLRREELRREWADFVERADARRREGMPLLTSALVAQRREIGPSKPDYLAAIGIRSLEHGDSSLVGEGIASEPRPGASVLPANGSDQRADAPSPTSPNRGARP